MFTCVHTKLESTKLKLQVTVVACGDAWTSQVLALHSSEGRLPLGSIVAGAPLVRSNHYTIPINDNNIQALYTQFLSSERTSQTQPPPSLAPPTVAGPSGLTAQQPPKTIPTAPVLPPTPLVSSSTSRPELSAEHITLPNFSDDSDEDEVGKASSRHRTNEFRSFIERSFADLGSMPSPPVGVSCKNHVVSQFWKDSISYKSLRKHAQITQQVTAFKAAKTLGAPSGEGKSSAANQEHPNQYETVNLPTLVSPSTPPPNPPVYRKATPPSPLQTAKVAASTLRRKAAPALPSSAAQVVTAISRPRRSTAVRTEQAQYAIDTTRKGKKSRTDLYHSHVLPI
ncbi:hypothetical protein FRC12_010623 [Ceratobasidium sp. 428]|nr:hypothetical protein FRC12_010623 [Ceratobasidium sp. 428]